MSSRRTTPSICRVCPNYCPILVDIEDERVTRVIGDKDNPLYRGYTCEKGRSLPRLLNHRERLVRSMRKTGAEFEPVSSDQALDEIAERLMSIIERFGSRAVSTYVGTYAYMGNIATVPIMNAFFDAIGTGMRFTSATIDQPGKVIALGLHGIWHAGAQQWDSADVALFVGINPPVSHSFTPSASPRWIAAAKDRGTALIVIDPRRTELARRAALHLQPRPGHDIEILAAMLRVILEEGLGDRDFMAQEVSGVAALRSAVAAFEPSTVGSRAGLDQDDIVRAARLFASGTRGYAVAGTGASMSQSSTLFEYLLMALKSVCGYWQRAGEAIGNPGTLMPPFEGVAQAIPPFPAFGLQEKMRVRDLPDSLLGAPTSAAADEMLLEGAGQIKSLISVGGNPVVSWPDQYRTAKALQSLDLLVQIDPWMSQTAQMAHFVVAPKLCLEVVGTNAYQDVLERSTGLNRCEPHAQYTAAVIDPPQGSDLLEEWQFFYRLAQRMGLQLTLGPLMPDPALAPVELDMSREPTPDELLALLTRGSRIPLDTVKQFPHGALFEEPAVMVAPKAPGWTGRLDVGNPEMISDLRSTADNLNCAVDVAEYPFKLISRRMSHVLNSALAQGADPRHPAHNPAYLHPDDAQALAVQPGDVVEVRSARAGILCIVAVDPDLRPGCVSIAHAFGTLAETADDVHVKGSPTARLVDVEDNFERYSGQPRMSGIPVAVARYQRDQRANR